MAILLSFCLPPRGNQMPSPNCFVSNRSFSRRNVMLGAAGAALSAPFVSRGARAAAPNIRYATGGGIGPNEMETIIFLDYFKQNVLKNYGKVYTLDMTFTRG